MSVALEILSARRIEAQASLTRAENERSALEAHLETAKGRIADATAELADLDAALEAIAFPTTPKDTSA
ncbi:hypothetical protein MTE01_29010 [Microbacterium testaceum]|uniref:Uncharacterized protein n=1 Tax=Microbacterium testaceum TaxID=2033 RepID=A0A4Y3QNE6_MICTE|nr:hypothetical protein [Microbacterium testaceum]GEB46956.1 hypothetical protein MTE01_29010 [Microbacterium testaceum]